FTGNGRPLYLKLAFEEARRWTSYTRPTQTVLSLDIEGVIRSLLARLSADENHGAVLVSHSLVYLAVARNGLSEDELLNVLSMDEVVMAAFHAPSPKSPPVDQLPVVMWSRLYSELQPYLAERSGDGTTLLGFYHQQVRAVVEQDYLARDQKRERHLTLTR